MGHDRVECRAYRLPDLTIFDAPQAQHVDESNRATILEDTLASFGVGAKVVHIERGPSITRYELKPERGVKISRISALTDDLALALAATSVRIEAPIPGKSAVGIEVHKKIGDRVLAGEPLCIVHCHSDAQGVRAKKLLEESYRIEDAPPTHKQALIHRVIYKGEY